MFYHSIYDRPTPSPPAAPRGVAFVENPGGGVCGSDVELLDAKVAEPVIVGNELQRRVQAKDVAALLVALVADEHQVFVPGGVALVAKGVGVHHDDVQLVGLVLDLEFPPLEELGAKEVVSHEHPENLAFYFAHGAFVGLRGPVLNTRDAVVMVAVEDAALLGYGFHANHTVVGAFFLDFSWRWFFVFETVVGSRIIFSVFFSE